ncbi:MAG TPA: hypothetical protein VMW48_06000 [Vicinamibacterales bacterium]|nr:hypothetical protein [Vicinamibacterales bacterium]
MRGRAFADVLDHALRSGAGASSALGTPRRFAPPQPVPLLFVAMPPPASRARTVYGRASVPVESSVARLPARALTPAQARARDGFNALGGRLGADFTGRELRTAYRLLAHRLHPDRHPACSAIERARLTRDFATAAGHYQVLLALFPRR